MINLQVTVGGEIYKNSNDSYTQAQKKFFLLIAISLLIAVAITYVIIRNIKDLIKKLSESIVKIAVSKEKYHSLLEHAADAIFVLNKDTLFKEINSSTIHLSGYSQQELLGMKFSEVFLPEELETNRVQLEALVKDDSILFESIWRRKDGTQVDVEINTKNLDSQGYLAIARDITGRKRIEEAVIESERKYRNIFENVQDVFYQTSIEGIILDVSPSIKSHTGYNREDLIGTSVNALYYDLADRQKLIDILKEKGEIKNYETRVKSSAGDLIYVDLHARLAREESGEATHLDCAFRNITDRKRIEAQLAEHKEQLALFIEYSPASLAMFDNEMNYIATSRRWVNDNNADGQELIGKNHYEVFPEIHQHWKDGHQRCLHGEVVKNEEDFLIRPDGSKDWIRWEIHPWKKVSGDVGGIIMFTEVITERKKATELFKYQFENSPDIILIIDMDFKIESINRGSQGGPLVKELIGLDSIAILPIESQVPAREAIERCFATGQNQEIENTLRNGNWVRSRFVPIISEGGISHIMVISTDITERKRAETNLKQSEEKHRALIENIADTIILINEDFQVIYQSPSFIRTAGFDLDNLKGKTFLEFVHPDHLQEIHENLQQSLTTPDKPKYFQYRIIHKRGHYMWIEGTITNLLHNESVKAFVVIYRDITERKNAEAKLLKSEASLKEAQAISLMGNWEIDMVNNIHTWSDEFFNIYGISKDEFSPSIETLLSFMHPDDLNFAQEEIKQAFSLLRNSSSDFRFKRSDQAIRYGHIEWKFEFNSDEQPIRMYGILQDITERKLAEQEREKITTDLIQRNQDLEQFAYIISHNLRAPLANVIGISQLMQLSVLDENETEEMIEAISVNVKKIDRVIIDLTRILEAKQEVNKKKKELIKFSEILGDIKASIFDLIEKEKIVIQCDFSAIDEMLTIKSYIYSIFLNLITNSIKYRQQNIPLKIAIISLLSDNCVTLIFRDNGLGINMPKNGDEIFGLYKRFHYHVEGKGMGLYMVKTQVEILGGRINVQSEINKGAEFKIEFNNIMM